MTYAVRLDESADRDLDRLPDDVRRRVFGRLDMLATDPQAPWTQALKGNLKGLRRFRIGDYRVSYYVDTAAQEIVVTEAGHRRDIYARMGRRH